MDRRIFLKMALFSSLPVFSFGKIKLMDVDFENAEKINLKKTSILGNKHDEDKEILESFLTPDPDERVLKSFLKDDLVFQSRGRIRQIGQVRRLNLYNPHTNERFKEVYYSNGRYNHRVLTKLNYFLRDFREKKSKNMDIELVDLVYSIQKSVSSNKPLTVLSGYRTRKTNEKLRRRMRGVAKNSFHIKGRAMDLAPFDGSRYKLSKMKKFARSKKVGGVGYYRRKGFVHVDTGPVRHWG